MDKDTCDICANEDVQCYVCECSLKTCPECMVAWGRAQCSGPECNRVITRYTAFKMLGYDFAAKDRVTQMLEEQRALLPVSAMYEEYKKYNAERKRMSRYGSQMVARGFVPNLQFEAMEKDAFHDSKLDIEGHVANMSVRTCLADGCTGSIVNYVCCLCKVEICRSCDSIIKPDHKCNDEDLKSVIEIRKETKKCPSCAAPVMKSYGCNHMRCTKCGGHFDWSTGRVMSTSTNPITDGEVFGVQTSQIQPSDPDFIEYGRNPNAIHLYVATNYGDNIDRAFRIELLRARQTFLLNNNEESWRQIIHHISMVHDGQTQVRNILRVYATALAAKQNLTELIKNTNDSLAEIAKFYGIKTPRVCQSHNNPGVHPIVGCSKIPEHDVAHGGAHAGIIRRPGSRWCDTSEHNLFSYSP